MGGGTVVQILVIGLGALWLIGAEVGRYRGAKLQVELKMKLIEKFAISSINRQWPRRQRQRQHKLQKLRRKMHGRQNLPSSRP